MEYHTPKGVLKNNQELTNQIGNVGHIALKVTNIEEAFSFLKSLEEEIKFITNNKEYKAFKIDNIKPDDFMFFHEELEKDKKQKENACNIVSNIKYFYFIDKYGVQ